jgi:hypothetical protein
MVAAVVVRLILGSTEKAKTQTGTSPKLGTATPRSAPPSSDRFSCVAVFTCGDNAYKFGIPISGSRS